MTTPVALVAIDTGELLREDDMTPVANVDLNEVPFEDWETIVRFANAGPTAVSALREARLTLSVHPDTQHVLRLVDDALAKLAA